MSKNTKKFLIIFKYSDELYINVSLKEMEEMIGLYILRVIFATRLNLHKKVAYVFCQSCRFARSLSIVLSSTLSF